MTVIAAASIYIGTIIIICLAIGSGERNYQAEDPDS